MKIAVGSTTDDMNGNIDERFSMSKYLLILDINDNTLEIEDKTSYKCDISQKALAEYVLREDCEAIISGIIDNDAFNVLADKCVTRYNGIGYTVNRAVDLMSQNGLQLFICTEDEDGCQGHEHEE